MTDHEFATIMRQWANLGEAELSRAWSWRGRDLNVREALYRTLEDHHELLVRRRTSAALTETQAILSLAQRALGDLCGLCCAVPADLLDAGPRAGEWSLRQVLKHLIVVEQRYAAQTFYASRRADREPLRLPPDRLREAETVDDSGGVDDLLSRLERARRESNRLLWTLGDRELDRPTDWAGYDVTVRFRLHRFAVHLAEHTIQCEKTLDALGSDQREGRRIVRQIWAARGELEILAESDALRALDAQLTERAQSLVRVEPARP